MGRTESKNINMTQGEIKQKADIVREKLRLHRKQVERTEEDIIDEWREIQRLCSHPDLKGKMEGYCPDCGYAYG